MLSKKVEIVVWAICYPTGIIEGNWRRIMIAASSGHRQRTSIANERGMRGGERNNHEGNGFVKNTGWGTLSRIHDCNEYNVKLVGCTILISAASPQLGGLVPTKKKMVVPASIYIYRIGVVPHPRDGRCGLYRGA